MAEKDRDPSFIALEAVYQALKNLGVADRKRVLSSALALLDLEGGLPVHASSYHRAQDDEMPTSASSRPLSLVELLNEKRPGTNAQRIALFAYYREKSEGKSRFGRDDLKTYFAKAKQPPAGNFDRDFVKAVLKGWIHEDEEESYLTTKGIEIVESGFDGERKSIKGRRPPNSAKRSAKKKSKKR